MQVCPVGFFCFDKNTFLLIIVTIIVIVVYFIHTNNIKFDKQKLKLEDRKNQYLSLKNELNNANNKIDNANYKIENTKNKINQIEDENEKIKYNLNDQIYVSNKDQQRIFNPLYGPERSYPHRINHLGVPINIPTRGYSEGYQQVGALIQEGNGNDDNKKILPLYGMPTYPGSRQWLYYTGSDNYSAVKLPIENHGKDCQSDYGCSEIYDGDSIKVTGYSSDFKVNLYKLDKPRYLPFIY